jgi:hypothetical protein
MPTNAALLAKVQKFLDKITAETIARLHEQDLDCWANIVQAKATVNRDGRKYIAIAVGTGMRYFVEKSTGIIYPSASWKTPNLKRSFGTLDTIEDFNWGGYEAVAKPGTPWKMKKLNHYSTAVPV